MSDLEKCVDDLKKIKGLPPYDGSTNYVRNDNYFGAYIDRTYSKETIKEAERLINSHQTSNYTHQEILVEATPEIKIEEGKEEVVEEVKKEVSLSDNVKKYLELKQQDDSIKDQMDTLKESIVTKMNLTNQTAFSTEDGVTAKLTTKVTFDYQDEPAMIEWLEKKGMTSYITKKINATSLNKELKTSTMLNEGLGSMFVKKSSVSLAVSAGEDK